MTLTFSSGYSQAKLNMMREALARLDRKLMNTRPVLLRSGRIDGFYYGFYGFKIPQVMKTKRTLQGKKLDGMPGEIRTPDPLLRSCQSNLFAGVRRYAEMQ